MTSPLRVPSLALVVSVSVAACAGALGCQGFDNTPSRDSGVDTGGSGWGYDSAFDTNFDFPDTRTPPRDGGTSDAGSTDDGGEETSVDPCSIDNGGCDLHALCATSASPDAGGADASDASDSGDAEGADGADSAIDTTGSGDAAGGAVRCACLPGYFGDGRTCAPMDSCTRDHGGCDPHAICTSTGIGTNSCACDATHYGDGKTCSPNDSCTVDNGGCDPRAICTSTGIGTNTCACKPDDFGDGKTCKPKDSCTLDHGGCDVDAVCTSTGIGTNTCACKPYYFGDGKTCTPANSCWKDYGGCDTHAICVSTGLGTNVCECSGGYFGTGKVCTPLDSCTVGNGGCAPDATCTSTGVGVNTCACHPGFFGDGTHCVAYSVITPPTPYLGKLAQAPDGSTWFLAGQQIAHIAKDGKYLGAFDAKILATDLTWGPDGAVWFSAEWTAGLGRLSPSGVLTMFPAPIDPGDYGSGFGSSVTNGPGGNLYYLDVRSDTLHRMTPSGSDAVLASALGGMGLAMGADGNLWVAGGTRIEKVTAAGAVSRYSLGSTGDARAIAPGPDSNVWFVETSTNAIGRITPSGVVSVFPLPNPTADPTYRSGVNSLVAGSDGNVWFTELESGRVGRITPSGVITEYPLPKAIAGVGWIAPGPDGTLQFGELHEVGIVRFHP